MIYRYLGRGLEFHPGVPARDLSSDEFAALPEDLQALVIDGHLYEAVAESAPSTDLPPSGTGDA